MTARTLDAVAATELSPPRAYGTQPADLDLSFDDPNQPAVITAVLAHCCDPASPLGLAEREAAAWAWSIGERILRLLRVVALTESADALTVEVRCPQPECRQRFELTLRFAELFALADSARPAGNVVPFPGANGETLRLRLPTGRDQAAWQARAYPNPQAALTAMVHSLLPPEAPALIATAPAQLESLASALEAADPLVAFQVQTRCPHCDQAAELPLDLAAAALHRLSLQRRRLLEDVHLLASHYGWTESTVLAIPAQRRAEYRRLLAAAAESRP